MNIFYILNNGRSLLCHLEVIAILFCITLNCEEWLF